MGTVWRAVHTRLEKQVALKLLNRRMSNQPDAIARFAREMKAVGQLEHPNIVLATDAGESDGNPFLVMEFVEGMDLGRLVKQRGPMKVADACEAARQAAIALQHAHEHGMVHRDVKPGNLILASDGLVKLLDLGLARLPNAVEPAPTGGDTTACIAADLTDTNMLVGTSGYMAPEQRRDPRLVDAKADVFALGRTLCFLLTGSPDLPAGGALPSGLLKVLRRLQADSVEDRYATAGAAANALRPWSRGHDLSALAGRPRRRSRWRRYAAAAAVVVLFSGAITVALLVPRSHQSISESGQTPDVAPMPREVPVAGRLGMTIVQAQTLQQKWAGFVGQEPTVRDGLGMELILIPPGEVVIKNVTTVVITKPYRLGATEVTRAQFQAFVTATGYRTDGERRGGGKYIWQVRTDTGALLPKEKFSLDYTWRTPGYDELTDTDPVNQVSWNDAVAFCKWLSEREGKVYRLPTVAEQTWAARAGEATSNPGDIVGRIEGIHLNDFAWTNRKTPMQPQPVAKLKSNAWGLYDTVGNVAEWCQDRSGPLPGGVHTDYAGTDRGLLRLLVGGSYREFGAYGFFEMNTPDARNSKTGFRVLREP
jgi:serine/threonine protein kinase